MNRPGTTEHTRQIITHQTGRRPRAPYRVAVTCRLGHPVVIVSPSVLEDGDRFPTFAWLTCPWLAEKLSSAESAGEMAVWETLAAEDGEFARALEAADEQLRSLRAAENIGDDPCAGAGIAGRLSPGGIKCLHARVAAALLGIDDPVGRELLGRYGAECEDARCESLVSLQVGNRR